MNCKADQLFHISFDISHDSHLSEGRILLVVSGAKKLVEQNTLILHITCRSGYQALLVQDFAATLPSLPRLQQVTSHSQRTRRMRPSSLNDRGRRRQPNLSAYPIGRSPKCTTSSPLALHSTDVFATLSCKKKFY